MMVIIQTSMWHYTTSYTKKINNDVNYSTQALERKIERDCLELNSPAVYIHIDNVQEWLDNSTNDTIRMWPLYNLWLNIRALLDSQHVFVCISGNDMILSSLGNHDGRLGYGSAPSAGNLEHIQPELFTELMIEELIMESKWGDITVAQALELEGELFVKHFIGLPSDYLNC